MNKTTVNDIAHDFHNSTL